MILQPVVSGSIGRRRISFITSPDGVSTSFPTVIKFWVLSPFDEQVTYNGVLLERGASADYDVAESGGAGTGYDTVEFKFTPRSGDKIEMFGLPA